ncbi:hypothetical protein BHF69_07580 [Anaerostipes sp. 992a]|nr:hypothetical protein BHF69_07580 [Anaerostipes sp. 992a]
MIFHKRFYTGMNISIWLSVQICDNPETNSKKSIPFSFKFFLGGKIISPEIIRWLIQNHHLLLYFPILYNIKVGQFWCLSSFSRYPNAKLIGKIHIIFKDGFLQEYKLMVE